MAVTYTGSKIVANGSGNDILFSGLGKTWGPLGTLWLRVFDPEDLTVIISDTQLDAVVGDGQAGYLPDDDGVFVFTMTRPYIDVPIKLFIKTGSGNDYLDPSVDYYVRVYH